VAAEGWKVGGAECSCIVVTRTVREAHSEHVKHALLLGGSGGMPPRKILKNKCYGSATRLNLEAVLANPSNEIVSSY